MEIRYLILSVQASYRVYCLLGDGESAEGSVWEAACEYTVDRKEEIV